MDEHGSLLHIIIITLTYNNDRILMIYNNEEFSKPYFQCIGSQVFFIFTLFYEFSSIKMLSY